MTVETPKKSPLYELQEKWSDCTRCKLSETRSNVVFGEGNSKADILIVGEAPGATEDKTGKPFQGDAGKVLNEFLDGMKLDRKTDLFITNVVCCRPTMEVKDERTGGTKTENRLPNKDERSACHTRLMETVYLVDPLLIITVGKVPFQALLSKGAKMASVRGRMHTLHLPGRYTELRYAVLPMYHTAFLLRTHDLRAEGPWGKSWGDWALACSVIDYLREAYYGTPQPDRGGSNG